MNLYGGLMTFLLVPKAGWDSVGQQQLLDGLLCCLVLAFMIHTHSDDSNVSSGTIIGQTFNITSVQQPGSLYGFIEGWRAARALKHKDEYKVLLLTVWAPLITCCCSSCRCGTATQWNINQRVITKHAHITAHYSATAEPNTVTSDHTSSTDANFPCTVRCRSVQLKKLYSSHREARPEANRR